MKRAPTAKLLIFLCVGILLQVYLLELTDAVCVVLLPLCFAGMAVEMPRRSLNRPVLFGLYQALFWLFVGCWVAPNDQTGAVLKQMENPQHCLVYRQTLAKSERTVQSIFAYSSTKNTFYVKLTFTQACSLRLGDKILTSKSLHLIPPPAYPKVFDARSYYQNQQIYCTAFIDTGDFVLLSRGHFDLKSYAGKIRSQLLARYREHLEASSYALLAALFFGDKSSLTKDTKYSFQNTGAFHLLAVSGLHVGILCWVLSFLFPQCCYRNNHLLRSIRLIIMLLCLIGFALLTGFSTSVVRATVMMAVWLISQNIERQYNVYNALSVSAFLVLLTMPNSLFTIGFWFSYLAVFGIVSIFPTLDNWLYFPTYLVRKIWQSITLSFSAQLLLLPFSFYFFGTLSKISLVTNLLVVVFATVLVSSAVISLVALLHPDAFALVATVLDVLLNCFLALLNFLSARTELWQYRFDINQTLIAGSILGLVLLTASSSKRLFMRGLYLCVAVFVMYTTYIQLDKKRPRIVYYTHDGCYLLHLISSENQVVVSNLSSQKAHYLVQHYAKTFSSDTAFIFVEWESVYYSPNVVKLGSKIYFANTCIELSSLHAVSGKKSPPHASKLTSAKNMFQSPSGLKKNINFGSLITNSNSSGNTKFGSTRDPRLMIFRGPKKQHSEWVEVVLWK